MSIRIQPSEPAPEQGAAFQALYSAFTDLMELKPWTILEESMIVGVKHPENGSVYYAYFMGELGEVVGFNLYRGDDVAPWLWALDLIEQEGLSENEILSHQFFQLSAVDKKELEPEVLALHQAAGIKVPKGQAGFLEPIRYQGGYTPELMTAEEMKDIMPLLPGFRFLLESLSSGQLEDPEALAEVDECYVAEAGQEGEWVATVQPLPEPKPAELFEALPADPLAWAGLKMLPKGKEDFLFHAQLVPMPVKKDDGTGIFPLLLLCIGADSGMVMGMQMLDILSWKEEAASSMLRILQDLKIQPSGIHIADERMRPLAESCAQQMGVAVSFDDNGADMLDELFDAIGQQLGS